MWKKIWNDPVWSKVISWVIIGLLGIIVTIFMGWFSIVGSWISSVHKFLIEKNPISNWITIILMVLSGLGLLFLTIDIWNRISPPEADKPGWYSYTEDMFHNLLWRWGYDKDGNITRPCVYCPNCDCQLSITEGDFDPSVMSMTHSYQCPSCGKVHINNTRSSHGEIISKIMKLIDMNKRKKG